MAKQNERGCQNNILRVRRFFWKNNLFEKFKVFSSFLHFVQDVLSLSVGKKWNACQNSNQSIYTEDQISLKIEEKWKISKMFNFLVPTAKSSLRKCCGVLVKSVPILPKVTFWGKVTFLKICFFPYGTLSVSFTHYGKTISARFCKIFIRVRNFFWEDVFFIRFFWSFLPLLYIKQIVPSLWWKPWRVVNSAFYMWRTAFWGQTWKIRRVLLFSYLPWKNAEESLAHFSKLYLFCTQKHLEDICFSEIYFSLCWTLSVTFLPSGKTNSARLTKLHFTCPEKNFSRKKHLQWHKLLILSCRTYCDKNFAKIFR